MKNEFQISSNIKFVYNERDIIDSDPRGVFLVVDNEKTMRPLVGKNYAIPIYCPYFDNNKLRRLIKWLSRKTKKETPNERATKEETCKDV